MKFLEIKDKRLIVYIDLDECKNCHRLMVPDHEYEPGGISLWHYNIMKETYRNPGVCSDCVSKGSFPKRCDICMEEKQFPKEFKFELVEDAKYPEDETDYQYVCTSCVIIHAQEVISMMADADEIRELK